jgi:hypothetical protein
MISLPRLDPFRPTPILFPLGIFVWGDALIIGGFWLLTGTMMLVFGKTNWFPIVLFTFWWVRAMGEVVYWLNEQFATKHRNVPNKLWGHTLFPGEAIYFGYQLFWQMVMVGCTLGIIWQLTQSF